MDQDHVYKIFLGAPSIIQETAAEDSTVALATGALGGKMSILQDPFLEKGVIWQ
jgi:hypothetical protein